MQSYIAHKNTDGTLLYFLLCFVTSQACNLIYYLSFDKKGPGGDLIRVGLIRFPVSIPEVIHADVHQLIYTNYSAYQKKGNRTLQCSSVFIIQSTEIILSQAERPGF